VIRVVLPAHLKALARTTSDVELDVDSPTMASVLDALERRYPVLEGTIRDHLTKKRRPFVRYFAAQTDISHDPLDVPLPPAVTSGNEPLIILGAMAGG
jgi:molybdopterin synthase sulfur carrier subunit